MNVREKDNLAEKSHIISILLWRLNQLQKPQPSLPPLGQITITKSNRHEESAIKPYVWLMTIVINRDIIWITATLKGVKIFALELCAVYCSKVNWIHLDGLICQCFWDPTKRQLNCPWHWLRSTIFLTHCFGIACDVLAHPSTTSVFRLVFLMSMHNLCKEKSKLFCCPVGHQSELGIALCPTNNRSQSPLRDLDRASALWRAKRPFNFNETQVLPPQRDSTTLSLIEQIINNPSTFLCQQTSQPASCSHFWGKLNQISPHTPSPQRWK